MSNLDFYFIIIGKAVCIIAGLLLVALGLALAINFFWRKMLDAYGFLRLVSCWRRHGHKVPNEEELRNYGN